MIQISDEQVIGKIVQKFFDKYQKQFATNLVDLGTVIGYSANSTTRIDVQVLSSGSVYSNIAFSRGLTIKAGMSCLVVKYSANNPNTYVVVATW